MVGAFLVIGFVGWLAEFVAIAFLLSVAATVIAAIALVACLVAYGTALGRATKAEDWAWLFDLLAAPLLGVGLGYYFGVRNPNIMFGNSSHFGFWYVPFILVGLYGFWVAPFAAPILICDKKRRFRLLAYPSFFLATFFWVTVVLAEHHIHNL